MELFGLYLCPIQEDKKTQLTNVRQNENTR